MAGLGILGGGGWAALAGVLRARGWVSETISTLLMNYVAVLLVNFLVFGPWRDPEGVNYPQTAPFVEAAILPGLGDARGFTWGSSSALVALVAVRVRRWPAPGGGWRCARSAATWTPPGAAAFPIGRYVVGLMFVGGGLAGLAGMAEVSAIQGRLRPSLSPGYGYSGFLISWMAGGHPAGIVAAAFVLAVITAGGDILQMTQALPASVVNILLAVLLFVVLGRQARRG